ncbi:MAG: OmpA family protein [Pseudomonadota bacterium]
MRKRSQGAKPGQLPKAVAVRIKSLSEPAAIRTGLTGVFFATLLAAGSAAYFASAHGRSMPIAQVAVSQAPQLVSDVRMFVVRATAAPEPALDQPADLAAQQAGPPADAEQALPSRLLKLAQPELKSRPATALARLSGDRAQRTPDAPITVTAAKRRPPAIALTADDRKIPALSTSEVETRLPLGEPALARPAVKPTMAKLVAATPTDQDRTTPVTTGSTRLAAVKPGAPAAAKPSPPVCNAAVREAARAATVWFRVGRAEITPGHKAKLEALADRMRGCGRGLFEVAGHTDSFGGDASNFRLSWRRAEAVAGLLGSLGVPQQRMVIVGYGSQKPYVESDATGADAARAINRRVEIRVR